MTYDLNQLQSLVANPSESLSVELKGWLDLKNLQHLAKVAKTLLALRNRNGGFLILGVDGTTLNADVVNPKAADVRAAYHTDVIQAIASRFASEIFAIEVHFIEHGNETFPVICVPAGVKTVVAAKENLLEGGKPLVKQNQVYVRTLHSNGTVSTSEAHFSDWSAILEVCMDNREADVARFLRRHFGDRDVAGALNALRSPQSDRLVKFQQSSLGRFNTVVDRVAHQIPNVGFWDVAAVVDGKVPEGRCNREFLNLINRANPEVTGWPLWLNGQSAQIAHGHESPVNNFWEQALIQAPLTESDGGFARHIDFWRVSPMGEMYALRFLEDDMLPDRRGIKPLSVLDYSIVVWRTTEALLVPLAFARAMGCDPNSCSVDYLFSWARLKGRELTCWSDFGLAFYGGRAVQDSISTRTRVPLLTAPSAIAPYVHQVVQPLFELFGGTDVKLPVISSIVEKIIKGK